MHLNIMQQHLNQDVCWGYEDECPLGPRSYSHPICDGDHKGWVKNKEEQLETFYKQADFGYVRSFRNSLRVLCKPESPVRVFSFHQFTNKIKLKAIRSDHICRGLVTGRV